MPMMTSALARRPMSAYGGFGPSSYAESRPLAPVARPDWRERLRNTARLFSRDRPAGAKAMTASTAKKVAEAGVRTLAVGGSAYLFGYVQGRFGAKSPLGGPTDLIAAITLHTIGLTGWAEPYAHHIHAVADGALAAYLAAHGRGKGKEVRAAKNLPEVAGACARPELTGGGGLSDEDLARIART